MQRSDLKSRRIQDVFVEPFSVGEQAKGDAERGCREQAPDAAE